MGFHSSVGRAQPAEATGSNPVEASKNFFSRLIRNCLNCDYNCDHLHFICISVVHITFNQCDVCVGSDPRKMKPWVVWSSGLGWFSLATESESES